MSIEADLKKEGIEVTGKLDTLKVNTIAKTISEILVYAFPEQDFRKYELFQKISRLNMYTTKVSNGLSEANYYYKNTSIYFNEKIQFNEIYKYAMHECIHYLQERKSDRGKLLKLGLAYTTGVKAYGIGINEAAVQFATSKALGFNKDSVKYYDISFETISPNFYPLQCNLINQMSYITSEYCLLDSTFNSNNNFKNKFINLTSKDTYQIIENNFDKILYAEESLIKLNNKLSNGIESKNSLNTKIIKQKNIIKSAYFETQNLIISSYFKKAFKNLKNLSEINEFRVKLYNFKNLIGYVDNYFFYNNFYLEMMEKLEEKKNAFEAGIDFNEINKKEITVVKENKFFKLLIAIKNFLFKPGNEYEKI